MSFALSVPAGWSELTPEQPIIIGDIATSWASMLAWTTQYRTAQGIKAIEETPIPEGKVSTGSSIIDYDGKPVRTHDLEDAPEPIATVPESVTMRQARIALSRAGILAAAEAAIAAILGQTGQEARIEWEYATELRRDHALVVGIGNGLGLSEAAKDTLFINAAQIV